MTFVFGSSAVEVNGRQRHHPPGRRPCLAPIVDLDVGRRRGERAPVREEIAASWRECIASGLDPQRLAVHRDDIDDTDDTEDTTDELIRNGRPVIERLADDLAGTGVSVALSDASVRVVARRTPDEHQRHLLDAAFMAPGCVWRIDAVGTNALGLAAQHRTPAIVQGREHFMDALSQLTMASAPINHPRTGDYAGAVTLVCCAPLTTPLLLAVARRAAREVENALLDGGSDRERLLEEQFLRARRRARAPLAVVSERALLLNAPASRLFERDDQPKLWKLAEDAARTGAQQTAVFLAGDGTPVVADIEPVRDGGDLAGVILRPVRITDVGEPTDLSGRRTTQPRPVVGWESLTESERGLADLVANGLTNKEVGARLFQSRHTVDSHLRHIFAKLGIKSRVELARLVPATRPSSTNGHATDGGR